MSNQIKQLCEAPAGQPEVLQGNIAFAVGCVRGGLHCADGYPGTPSSEVIDKGLSEVQDLIKVGWSVNEAVASAVGVGHSIAGSDCVVTMKIPGLFQAADVFTSGSVWSHARGALVYYIASDFAPSSTQHIIDPRYLFKSCFVPVFEPRDHQEMHLAAGIAAEISRTHRTQVVVMPSGVLCHSEGLVRMMPREQREPLAMSSDLRAFNVLPNLTRGYYDTIMDTRMPALVELVEQSPLNHWIKGSGKRGVVTYGSATCTSARFWRPRIWIWTCSRSPSPPAPHAADPGVPCFHRRGGARHRGRLPLPAGGHGTGRSQGGRQGALQQGHGVDPGPHRRAAGHKGARQGQQSCGACSARPSSVRAAPTGSSRKKSLP